MRSFAAFQSLRAILLQTGAGNRPSRHTSLDHLRGRLQSPEGGDFQGVYSALHGTDAGGGGTDLDGRRCGNRCSRSGLQIDSEERALRRGACGSPETGETAAPGFRPHGNAGCSVKRNTMRGVAMQSLLRSRDRPLCRLQGEFFHRQRRQIRGAAKFQLGQNISPMCLYGLGADVHPLRDLAPPRSFRD